MNTINGKPSSSQAGKLFKVLAVLVVLIFLGKVVYSHFFPPSVLEVIRSAKVTKGNLEITVSATGDVKPYNRVEIRPPIAGRLDQVLVREGDNVKQGQILVWMSSTDRAALLDSARSQGDEVYKKWLTAYKPTPLMSPMNGTVIVQSMQPGQTVAASDPVVVLSDRLIVIAQVDETDLARIEVGQKVNMLLDAYPDKKFAGKVDHISYESQRVNNVNVYNVYIVPEEVPAAFRSGMTANVTFIVDELENVLTVPAEAITEWPKKIKKPDGAEFAVYRKDFHGLAPIPVEIGDSDGRMTEITNGLTEGMEIQIVRKKQNKNGGSAFSSSGGRPPAGVGASRAAR